MAELTHANVAQHARVVAVRVPRDVHCTIVRRRSGG